MLRGRLRQVEKCRCSKVLEITSLDGKEVFNDGTSDRDFNFIYKVGEFVEVDNFDQDRWNECSFFYHTKKLWSIRRRKNEKTD